MSIFSNRSAPAHTPGRGICPHLGVREDPQTCLAYPSKWNLCNHVRRPAAVRLEHQRATCLLPAHTACPVFQSRAAVLPAQLRARRMALGPGKTVLLFLLLALVLGFGLWAAWYRDSGLALPVFNDASVKVAGSELPLGIDTPLSAAQAEKSEATPVAFRMTFSPAAPAQIPSATSVAVKNCGAELEGRIDVGQYVLTLHRVSYGESMDLLAAQYETSLPAIQAVNYFLPSPLWSDLVIVIPVGISEISGLPFFEPYFVPDPVASLDVIAQQVSVPGSDLMEYNNLNGDCPVYAGWLLLPRPDRKNP